MTRICEMCGKSIIRFEEHHVIPWNFSHDDSESNIIRVCSSCHHKADNGFLTFIVYGKLSLNKDKVRMHHHSRIYNKKYTKLRILASVKLLKNTFYRDLLNYNARTGHVGIHQVWQYYPNGHFGGRIKNRKCLAKAAAASSQTSLFSR